MNISEASQLVAFIDALSVGEPRRDDALDDKLDVLAGRGVEGLDISTNNMYYITHMYSHQETLTCLISSIGMPRSLPSMSRMLIFDIHIYILPYYRASFIN